MKPEPIPPPVLDWAFLRRQVVEAQAALGIQAERQGGVSRDTQRVTCGWLEILEAVARRLLLIAATPLFWKLEERLRAKRAAQAAAPPVEEETQTEALVEPLDEAPPESTPAPAAPKPKRPAFRYVAKRPPRGPRDPDAPVRPFELWEWRKFVSQEALDRRFDALIAVIEDPAHYARGMARVLLKNYDAAWAAIVELPKRWRYRKKMSAPGLRFWSMLEEADFLLMASPMKRPADTS